MLQRLDEHLLLFLNSIHSPFFDQVMYALSGRLIWAPLYLAILVYIAMKEKKKFFLIVLFIILAVTLSDQFSVLIKNLVHRPRPCHNAAINSLIHLHKGECGGLYGFVSSHASNSFNVALLSLNFVKKRWFTICIVTWAAVICYSRVYLGVHYPGDVIGGAIVGALVGWGVYNLYVFTESKFSQKASKDIM